MMQVRDSIGQIVIPENADVGDLITCCVHAYVYCACMHALRLLGWAHVCMRCMGHTFPISVSYVACMRCLRHTARRYMAGQGSTSTLYRHGRGTRPVGGGAPVQGPRERERSETPPRSACSTLAKLWPGKVSLVFARFAECRIKTTRPPHQNNQQQTYLQLIYLHANNCLLASTNKQTLITFFKHALPLDLD